MTGLVNQGSQVCYSASPVCQTQMRYKLWPCLHMDLISCWWDVKHKQMQSYIHQARSLAVPTPFENKTIHFIRITSGFEWKIVKFVWLMI